MSDQKRSPRYPAIDLKEAIELAKKLWDKERRSAVASEVLAAAWGYKGLSGPVRVRIGALRQYGLLDNHEHGVRLSDNGMKLLHNAVGSPEYTSALKTAALAPELFGSLLKSHPDASQGAIKSFLVLNKGFSESGADQCAATFRATLALAKLNAEGYNSTNDDDDNEIKVGDIVQWTSQGVDQFQAPRRVRGLSDDGDFAFVEGENTGVPVQELTVVDMPISPVTEKESGSANPPKEPKQPLKVPPAAPSMRSYAWALSGDFSAKLDLYGEAKSAEDIDALADYVEITVKALKRSLKARQGVSE